MKGTTEINVCHGGNSKAFIRKKSAVASGHSFSLQNLVISGDVLHYLTLLQGVAAREVNGQLRKTFHTLVNCRFRHSIIPVNLH